jgi:hypothetical protein
MKFKSIKKLFLLKIKKFKRIIKIKILILIRNYKLQWKYKKRKFLIKYSIISILTILTILALRTKIQIVDKSTHTKEIYIADTINTLTEFLYQLRYIESNDNYKARRREIVIMKTSHGLDTIIAYSQYIGYYQMGVSSRKSIGMGNIPIKKYWNSPELQHKSVLLWLIYLKTYLSDEIEKWDNKFYGSFYITESGLLAMSHLIGPNRVKRWLNSGRYNLTYTYHIVDGNGKKGVDYLQQLGRYNLKLERFIDDGEIVEKRINKFLENIKDKKLPFNDDNLSLEQKYIIIDSVNYVKDSIIHRLPKIKN